MFSRDCWRYRFFRVHNHDIQNISIETTRLTQNFIGSLQEQNGICSFICDWLTFRHIFFPFLDFSNCDRALNSLSRCSVDLAGRDAKRQVRTSRQQYCLMVKALCLVPVDDRFFVFARGGYVKYDVNGGDIVSNLTSRFSLIGKRVARSRAQDRSCTP